MIGVVQSRELLAALLRASRSTSARYVQPAPVIPDTLYALDALAILRDSEVPMALVHDEYGHFEGVVTPGRRLEAIVGAFRSDTVERRARCRAARGRIVAARRLHARR